MGGPSKRAAHFGIVIVKGAMADPRKEYEIEVSGIKHTVLLLPEDAERYGKDAVEVKAATPANKAATPANK